MKRWIKYGGVAAGAVTLLLVCAPSLVALLFAGVSWRQYQSESAIRIGRLAVPGEKIVLTLWSKPQSRSFSSEGADRILQVSQAGSPDAYYPLSPVPPGETRELAVVWFPAGRAFKLTDTGTQKAAGEIFVDLRLRRLMALNPGGGADASYRFCEAAPSLQFQFSPHREWKVAFEDDAAVRLSTGQAVPVGVLNRRPPPLPEQK